jgi:hypothetical protein
MNTCVLITCGDDEQCDKEVCTLRYKYKTIKSVYASVYDVCMQINTAIISARHYSNAVVMLRRK